MRRFTIFILQAYQWLISPMLHTIMPVRSGCRFTPTCSENAIDTIRREGVIPGVRKGLSQLSRCHPYAHDMQNKR